MTSKSTASHWTRTVENHTPLPLSLQFPPPVTLLQDSSQKSYDYNALRKKIAVGDPTNSHRGVSPGGTGGRVGSLFAPPKLPVSTLSHRASPLPSRGCRVEGRQYPQDAPDAERARVGCPTVKPGGPLARFLRSGRATGWLAQGSGGYSIAHRLDVGGRSGALSFFISVLPYASLCHL